MTTAQLAVLVTALLLAAAGLVAMYVVTHPREQEDPYQPQSGRELNPEQQEHQETL